MTTEAITTTSLTASALAEIIDQAAPHQHRREEVTVLNATFLDSDGTHLHAVASDRFTIAVARARLASGEMWTALLSAANASALHGWAHAHNYRDAIHLTSAPGQLTARSNHGSIALPTVNGEFPAWRRLFRQHLDHPVEPVEMTRLTTEYLLRWEKAGRRIHFAQTGAERPLIVFGEDFLGLQMPLRWTDGTTRDTLTASWASSLGTPVDGPTELPLPDPLKAIPEMTENLLRQVLISSEDLFEAESLDTVAMRAHARCAVQAWTAHRLLQALQVADPQLAECVLRNVTDELECGDFAATAHEDAKKLGHDPAQWVADYKVARARRAEQEKADKAAAEQQTAQES